MALGETLLGVILLGGSIYFWLKHFEKKDNKKKTDSDTELEKLRLQKEILELKNKKK